MYKSDKEKQLSFYHPDVTCDQMFAEDNFYRNFRDKCDRFIEKIDFGALYFPDNGCPAASPGTLLKALVLQRLFDLSDRQLEESCRFDLRFKYVLDLNDMGFVSTALEN